MSRNNTDRRQRRVERIWNDRPEPKVAMAHAEWMNEFMQSDGSLLVNGARWEWDYRLNVWVGGAM